MWVMLHGLELTWLERVANLVAESDSKFLIDMVCQESLDDQNFPTLIGASNSTILGVKITIVHIR